MLYQAFLQKQLSKVILNITFFFPH